MAPFEIRTSEEAEALLTKVFEILDSYDFDRFPDVFAADLKYQGGLEENDSLDSFTTTLEKSVKSMPKMKTSHSRWKNDVTPELIYSHGSSTAEFDSGTVTIPMLGVYGYVKEGPEKGKINYMAIYKDRLPFMPFIQNLPGRGST